MDLNKVKNILLPILRKKYALALIIFGLWIIVFDKNSIINRFRELNKMHQLERDKEYYETKITEDSKQLNELRTNNENLEKFAREQYLMKKPNEDLFIIIEEDK